MFVSAPPIHVKIASLIQGILISLELLIKAGHQFNEHNIWQHVSVPFLMTVRESELSYSVEQMIKHNKTK